MEDGEGGTEEGPVPSRWQVPQQPGSPRKGRVLKALKKPRKLLACQPGSLWHFGSIPVGLVDT